MPSLLGHAVAGLAITAACHRDNLPRRTWALAPFCAVAPDLDWFMSLGALQPGNVFNHRGAAHSLFGALVIACLVLVLGYRKEHRRGRLWFCLAIAALSHGLLDACTAGGVGVALFMPFSDTRWACLFQPVRVAPLPVGREHILTFLGSLWTEAFWIGLPSLGVVAYARLVRQALPEAATEST